MSLKHLIIFCLVLNSCATTAPDTLDGYEFKNHEKNRALLNKYCEKNKKKVACVQWEHSKIDKEGHSHSPLWIWILTPWVLTFIMTIWFTSR